MGNATATALLDVARSLGGNARPVEWCAIRSHEVWKLFRIDALIVLMLVDVASLVCSGVICCQGD